MHTHPRNIEDTLNAAHNPTCLLRKLVAGVAGAAALVLSAPASAQVPAAFTGTWKATWQTENRLYEAAMTVTETGGSWQTATRDRNNPCAGREVPMKVESATADEVRLLLQFSEVIPGCTNVKVTMRTGPNGTVVGTRSKFDLTLKKQ
jgi:hypothetical protein